MKIPASLIHKLLKFRFNLYGPFLGAGIKVMDISPDFKSIKVKMALNGFNRNYVGTQFGGSLYSMVDPFYMLMLLNNLGNNYIVWDQAASIRFMKPGNGPVFAHFVLTEDQVENIRIQADNGEKILPEFDIDITNEEGAIIAQVHKTLYVRKKAKKLKST